ncbi:MAG: Dabb family protein [Planctomycetes bacterium]|nr:Dabb family protein [Planctomycetota bacterium]
MIGHMVYFTLKDNSDAAKKKLVDACKKHLSKHDGEVFFGAGTLATELKREVNDRDWDVALQIVFKDMTAQNKYQDHPRHKQFIEENRDNWTKVRVFDSVIEK